MWRILTASLGAGTVNGHRTIGVIPGGDQRPGQQEVSVPGARCGAQLAGTAHGASVSPAALRGSGSPLAALGPAGPVPQVLPSRTWVRVPVSRRGYRVTARAQAGNHTVGVMPSHPVRRQPGHGDYGLRHQADRMARQITMNFVWIRIITGEVARLAGSFEKATGAHEGKKEGRKQ